MGPTAASMQITVAVLLFLAGFCAVSANSAVSLSSQTWTVENGNRSIIETTTLPAYPLEILRAKGVITDPLFRYGEMESQWVALDNWTFSLALDGSTPQMKQLRSEREVLLKFDGIDTFATVELNGKVILAANNFHRHWTVPVKSLLVDGQNNLTIAIRPAATESTKLKTEHPYSIPNLNQMGSIGAYTFVRKPASDLGWDWGPAFGASGIHGNVELVGFSNAVLDGAFMSQRKVGSLFEVTITSKLLVPPGGDSGVITVSIPALNKVDKKAVQLGVNNPSTFVTIFTVNASDVNLWWPVGYGAPNLYDVSVTYAPNKPVCSLAGSAADRTAGTAPAAAGGADMPVGGGIAAAPRRGGMAKSSSRQEAAQQSNWEMTSPDGTFRLSNGMDLPSAVTIAKYDVTAMGNSLLECQRLCKGNPDCSFFTFTTPPAGVCELKKLREAPNTVFGVKLGANSYDLTTGLDLVGFDLEKPTSSPNVAACQARCNRNQRCKMFVVKGGMCHMKQPWPAVLNKLLGIKLTRTVPVDAELYDELAGTAAAAPEQTSDNEITDDLNMSDVADRDAQEAPAAVPDLQQQATAEQPAAASSAAAAAATSGAYGMAATPGGYAMNAVLSVGGYAMDTVGIAGGSVMSMATTPGAYAMGVDATPGGYVMNGAATPGGYATSAGGALDDIIDFFERLLPFPQPDTTQSGNAACAAAAASELNYRMGFRTVELVRVPIAEAVKDLFPANKTGWDVESTFGVSKSHWDGSWALSQEGRWQHFPKSGDQDDIEGESFYFKVNGIPIYMKGANLVPLHILPTNVSKDMIHDLMKYALQSNMNMIRVWGGGAYPVDELFKFADEHGLLMWMETMFACSPYPRDSAFLENVAEEVTQQLHRLSWHPSIGVWAGNNEIEGSLGWFSESRTNKQLFAGDYNALFVDTIRNIIHKDQPSMAFVDSSPSNGVIVSNDKLYIKRWGEDWDPRYGDVHHYAYDADCEDYSTYPKAKFISEFGSQSYPTFATYAEATLPMDWQVDNHMTGFRNRRFANGLEVLETQFKRHFRLPDSWSADDAQESYQLFRSFMYITHMQQSRCYEAAINYWRRLRAQPAGLTMGVLYWQLNDIAPFASWSAYDYGGRWKPLAYAVKRMYNPLQVQAIQDGPQTKIFMVNDYTQAVNTTITVQILSLQDTSDSCSEQQPFVTDFKTTVAPGFAEMVWNMPTSELIASRPGCSITSCYMEVTATGDAVTPNGEVQPEFSEVQMFFVPLKDINLPDPELEVHSFQAIGTSADNSRSAAPAPVNFTLKSSRPAVLTQFDTSFRGRFSDDAFTAVHPCKPKEVTFYPHESLGQLTPGQLAANLTVASLYNHQFGVAEGFQK